MLHLVGLGIWDEKDISLRGMEVCRQADKIYCELYTAQWGGDLKKLEKTAGKKITRLERGDLEERSEKFLDEAREKTVALLVPGDPLVATTHAHLIMDARNKNIPFRIVHSSSVYTAAAGTGLQVYKFGRTATIITPQKGYESEGFYRALKENHDQGLHTVLLLDRDMGTGRGMEILMGIDRKKGKKLVKKAVICSKLGSGDEDIVYGKAEELAEKDLPAPAVIIIPGNLHFMEKEFLESLR